MPGVGKSYYAAKRPCVVDFDLGLIRENLVSKSLPMKEAMKVNKKFYVPFIDILNLIFQDNDIILINDPSFAKVYKQHRKKIRLVFVLAGDANDWIRRIKERPDSDLNFIKLITSRAVDWFVGWKEKAESVADDILYLKEGQFLTDVIKQLK